MEDNMYIFFVFIVKKLISGLHLYAVHTTQRE